MRTSQVLYPQERIIYQSELIACHHCGEPLKLCKYLTWDKTVKTLDSTFSLSSHLGTYPHTECPSHQMQLLATQGQQIAPPGEVPSLAEELKQVVDSTQEQTEPAAAEDTDARVPFELLFCPELSQVAV